MISSKKSFVVRKPYDCVDSSSRCDDYVSVKEDSFRLIRDSHSNCIYEKIDEVDVQSNIDSYKTGASLKSLLDRCSLLPLHDKLAMTNQRVPGKSADLSCMPKDGTEAHIMINNLKSRFPDFAERLKKGETFESLINSVLSTNSGEDQEKHADGKLDHADGIANNSTNSGESEVK